LDIPQDVNKLIHELQVHQIELEMQNEELKNAQLKLQTSQNKYFKLYNFAPTGYFTLDEKELIKDVNLAGAALLGVGKKNLINSAFIRFVAHDSRNKFYKHIKRIRESGTNQQCELELINNGKPIYAHIETTAILDKSRNIKELQTTIIDISERLKMENTLKESKIKYKSLFESNPDYTVFLDPEGKILDANIVALETLGYNLEDITGLVLSELGIFPQEDIKIHKEKIHRLSQGKKVEPFLARLIDKKGKIHWCQNHLIPIIKEGNLLGFQAISHDITEKRLAEQKLRSSQIKLANAMEMSNLVNWEYDVTSDTFTFDDRFYALYGTTAEREGGPLMSSETYAREFVHPDDLGLVADEIEKAMKTSDPDYFSQLDHRIIRRDGNIRHLMVRIAITKDDEGRTIKTHGTNQDITELKEKEEEIRKSLQEKEVLLREIHHRVKNNLQIIASLLHLQEDSIDEKEVADVLKESEGRVKSMAMVHEKLYQSPSFSKINLKQYIEKLLSDIIFTYGTPTGSIKTKLIIKDINLNIDTAIPLGLIINELVTNSAKYAFPQSEGTITIKLKSLPEQMELTISDNGIGMPKDIDIKNSNTLGLQLVNGLVNQLDGELKLDRSHGTEFKIIFRELKYKERL
jgi:PAS domain S-box-containing protein